MASARMSSCLQASSSTLSCLPTAFYSQCSSIRFCARPRHTTGQQPRQGTRYRVSRPASAGKEAVTGISYDNLLLAIMDTNPYFSDGSKQALATAAGLANTHASKLTILLVDKDQTGMDQTTRIETISWHLKDSGFNPEQAAFKEVSLAAEETHNSSVVVGNAVDQIEADLVLLSTEAVHSKAIDANLLAEFVTCPVLLLP